MAVVVGFGATCFGLGVVYGAACAANRAATEGAVQAVLDTLYTARLPSLLVGDFNAEWDSLQAGRWMRAQGWRDVAEAVPGAAEVPTFVRGAQSSRHDYILCGPWASPAVSGYEVDVTSVFPNHRPISVHIAAQQLVGTQLWWPKVNAREFVEKDKRQARWQAQDFVLGNASPANDFVAWSRAAYAAISEEDGRVPGTWTAPRRRRVGTCPRPARAGAPDWYAEDVEAANAAVLRALRQAVALRDRLASVLSTTAMQGLALVEEAWRAHVRHIRRWTLLREATTLELLSPVWALDLEAIQHWIDTLQRIREHRRARWAKQRRHEFQRHMRSSWSCEPRLVYQELRRRLKPDASAAALGLRSGCARLRSQAGHRRPIEKGCHAAASVAGAGGSACVPESPTAAVEALGCRTIAEGG